MSQKSKEEELARRHEQRRHRGMRVAIQGEAGSNSHAAAMRLLAAHALLPCTLSDEVFERLAVTREADAAVLPIENSLHGAVADHYDLLLEHDVEIVAELSLRIRHALMAAPGISAAQVKRVLSHPVALSQCRRFFGAHPHIEAVPFYDTAGAVKHLVASGDKAAAAIAAPGAAEVYGAEILGRDLEDNPQNFTRFLLLTRRGESGEVRARDSVADKMSVAFTIAHKPGSLVQTLQRLAELQADLTRIESRPVPGRPWEYVFFVDLRLPSPETATEVVEALEGLCTAVKVLGLYATASPSA